MKMNPFTKSKSPKTWLTRFLVTTMTFTGFLILWPILQVESNTVSPIEQTEPVFKRITALGRLQPKTEVINLFAPIALDSDRVAQLLVKRGDWVESGQIVAILSSQNSLQANLEEAQQAVKVAQARLAQIKAGAKSGEIEAQKAKIMQLEADLQGQIAIQKSEITRWQSEVRTAKAEYERHLSLHEKGAITTSQLDNKRLAWETAQAQLTAVLSTKNRIVTTLKAEIAAAKATLNQIAEVRLIDVNVAEAEVEQAIAKAKKAQIQLDQASIRAPIAGQILKIHSYPGEIINEQDGIVELGQTKQMMVVAEVYQTDISQVRLGKTALITSNALSTKLRGIVSEIDLQVSQQNTFSNQPGENLDRRVVEVKISLTPEDSQKVSGLTNLQVETAILLENEP